MHKYATSGFGTSRKRPLAWLAALLVLAPCAAVVAQDPDTSHPFKGLSPAGCRSHLTESWGTLGFSLSNHADEDMEARVLAFYAGAPGRQFGRDVWVPAKATLRSWSCIGP